MFTWACLCAGKFKKPSQSAQCGKAAGCWLQQLSLTVLYSFFLSSTFACSLQTKLLEEIWLRQQNRERVYKRCDNLNIKAAYKMHQVSNHISHISSSVSYSRAIPYFRRVSDIYDCCKRLLLSFPPTPRRWLYKQSTGSVVRRRKITNLSSSAVFQFHFSPFCGFR